jgi:glycosyltransferase involved in cell wall biosynthesis
MKNKKRIDCVVKYFYPVTAGIEVNMLETYSVLAKEGWDITVHTSKDTYAEKDFLPEYEEYKGLKIKRYPFKFWGFVPKVDWKGKGLICFHNFDVFPHSVLLTYLTFIKLLGSKISVVLTPHGGFSLSTSWSTFPRWQRILKKAYHNILAPILINAVVDRVRAVSEWEKAEMIKDGINESLITTISNGIEDAAYENIEKLASEKIKERVKNWGKYIVRIGRIYPIKNDEIIIKALPHIHKDTKFVIVGPQEINKHKDYLDKLHELIKKLKLEDRVIFAGVIRGVDKYYVIKNSQTMVHMALWESFCNVVHEAMSQGLPVVVANNTALPYLVKDNVNGYLVDTYDHKKVAEKVNFVLKNKNSKKLLSMSSLNKKVAREHAWSRVAMKMDAMYQSLI